MIGPKLCGAINTGPTLQATGNVMTLHFHTVDVGRYVDRSGFKIYADAGKKFHVSHNCLADVNRILKLYLWI